MQANNKNCSLLDKLFLFALPVGEVEVVVDVALAVGRILQNYRHNIHFWGCSGHQQCKLLFVGIPTRNIARHSVIVKQADRLAMLVEQASRQTVAVNS